MRRLRRAPLVQIVLILLALIPATTGRAAAPPLTVQIEAGSAQNEFQFTPKEITVQAGQRVTITLVNKGKVEHDFVLEALKVKIPAPPEKVVAAGKSASVTLTPARKGIFEFVCTVPGHKEIGMKGTLTVK